MTFTLDTIDVHVDEASITADATMGIDGGIVLTIRELPFVSGFGPTYPEARADLDATLVRYKELLEKPETTCKECGHPYGVHYSTYDGRYAGCAGGDEDENGDDYCVKGCEAFDG